MTESWLEWIRSLQALAQAGLTYSENPFDLDRYKKIRELAAHMSASLSAEPLEQVRGIFADQAGYHTPKLDVRGGVIVDGKILLVRELQDGGRWTLPGGWIDPGDAPSEAAVREVREETGYLVRPLKLAAVYDRDRHGHTALFFSIYKLFFLCEMIGGAAAESIETGESAFFAPDALPELSLGRVTPAEIEMLFRHHREPGLETEYD